MTDLAILFNQALNLLDVAMAGPDLAADNGLETAVTLSLLLDRLALPGDVLPDPNSTDRRGWWGDAYLPSINGKPDFIGSRLWLLRRSDQTPATLQAAQNYALEALAWMVSDGVTGSLAVVCSYPALGAININVQLGKNGCDGKFDVQWQFALAGNG